MPARVEPRRPPPPQPRASSRRTRRANSRRHPHPRAACSCPHGDRATTSVRLHEARRSHLRDTSLDRARASAARGRAPTGVLRRLAFAAACEAIALNEASGSSGSRLGPAGRSKTRPWRRARAGFERRPRPRWPRRAAMSSMPSLSRSAPSTSTAMRRRSGRIAHVPRRT